jgi:indole-3-glycerol phosphate synthase
MENILHKIVQEKKREVDQLRLHFDPGAISFDRKCISLKERLLDKHCSGIIAEFKRRSPSKGWFKAEGYPAEAIVTSYEAFGAAGASILTDTGFFGGNIGDLIQVRTSSTLPLLRKDFIIDELQIQEAKMAGADVILLIAAILSPQRVKELASVVKRYGMEVLLEIHTAEEIEHICDDVDIVGVNNRNLDTFEVDVNTSIQLIKSIPSNKIAISESGINNVDTIEVLKEHGFKGFLIGEAFMKEDDTANSFKTFINTLKATA